MEKIIPVVCYLLFLISMKGASQSLYFDKTFGLANSQEFGWSVLIRDDSTYIALSAGLDLVSGYGAYNFSSFSENGDIISNSAYENISGDYYVGLCNTLFKLPDNGGYVFGGSKTDNATGNSDVIVVKFNNQGDTLFQKQYGDNDFEAPYFSTLTSDNKFILVGFKGGISAPNDVLLMKTDDNGNLIWQKTYGGTENNLGKSVFEKDLQYVIGGVKIFNGVNANPWIIVTDSSGNIVKEKEFIEPFYSCSMFLYPTLDGNYLMATCVDTIVEPGDYYRPACILKLDTGFNVIWKSVFNDDLDNGLYIAKELADSSIMFTGFQLGGSPNAPEGWIGKLDKSGNKLWEHQYRHNNSLANYFSDFEQTSDGGFIITGMTFGDVGQDMWLVKLDSLGCLEPCFTNSGTIETGDEVVSLQCFPNPARLQTAVLYNIPVTASEASIMINDLSGKMLSNFTLDRFANHADLNLSSWASGIYFCSLVIDGSIAKTVKLLIQ